MACFLAPTAEAIVMSIVKHSIKKKEENGELNIELSDKKTFVPFSKKLGWLTKMLWGGSFLLAIEHIWHGEVTFYPPFLTAMNSPADTITMLHEIATVGVGMALLVTSIWGLMVAVSVFVEKKSAKTTDKVNMEG